MNNCILTIKNGILISIAVVVFHFSHSLRTQRIPKGSSTPFFFNTKVPRFTHHPEIGAAVAVDQWSVIDHHFDDRCRKNKDGTPRPGLTKQNFDLIFSKKFHFKNFNLSQSILNKPIRKLRIRLGSNTNYHACQLAALTTRPYVSFQWK